MSELKALEQKIISQFKLPKHIKKVAAAVSGGCDSVAMLLLLKLYCRITKRQLCVFHIDHSLRKESEKDCQWVKKLAKSLKVDFFCVKATKEDLKINRKKGTEAWAREYRYQNFAKLIEKSGSDVVATGHNINDQVETVIMRLLRGSSTEGLAGIRSHKKIKIAGKTIKVWRPILKCDRTTLEKYLGLFNQSWIEDKTNNSLYYFRNKIRHELVPFLETIRPGTDKQLLLFSEKMADIATYLKRKANKYLQKHSSKNSLNIQKKLNKPLRCEILRLWLINNGLEKQISTANILRLNEMWIKPSLKNIDLRSMSFVKSHRQINICIKKSVNPEE